MKNTIKRRIGNKKLNDSAQNEGKSPKILSCKQDAPQSCACAPTYVPDVAWEQNYVNTISWYFLGLPPEMLCMFVCVEVQRPSQQFFSHVGSEPPLPGNYQYFRSVKCLAQGHNTAEVGFEPPTSRS